MLYSGTAAERTLLSMPYVLARKIIGGSLRLVFEFVARGYGMRRVVERVAVRMEAWW